MVKLKWTESKNGWRVYYKERLIEFHFNGSFSVNKKSTNNKNIKTIINFIDDGGYFI